jgi:hypothetical protein
VANQNSHENEEAEKEEQEPHKRLIDFSNEIFRVHVRIAISLFVFTIPSLFFSLRVFLAFTLLLGFFPTFLVLIRLVLVLSALSISKFSEKVLVILSALLIAEATRRTLSET